MSEKLLTAKEWANKWEEATGGHIFENDLSAILYNAKDDIIEQLGGEFRIPSALSLDQCRFFYYSKEDDNVFRQVMKPFNVEIEKNEKIPSLNNGDVEFTFISVDDYECAAECTLDLLECETDMCGLMDDEGPSL